MGRPPKPNIQSNLAELLERVGANLRDIRTTQGMTQAEVAKLSKVSLTTVNEIESQRARDIRLSTLVAIAEAVGVPVVRLLVESDVQLNTKDHARLLKASEDILKIVRKLPNSD